MKVFFASDIHGSTSCFRTLVNSGEFYGADVILMGGDMAGKELVPMVERGSGWTASFRGAVHELETREEAEEFERRVATVGPYTMRVTDEVVAELRTNQDLVEKTLRELIVERTEELIALAVTRLQGSGTRLLIGLGNDDFDEMIPYLDANPVAYAHDGELDLGDVSLMSLGWSNPTPWNTNRECTEDELAGRVACSGRSSVCRSDASPLRSSRSSRRTSTGRLQFAATFSVSRGSRSWACWA